MAGLNFLPARFASSSRCCSRSSRNLRNMIQVRRGRRSRSPLSPLSLRMMSRADFSSEPSICAVVIRAASRPFFFLVRAIVNVSTFLCGDAVGLVGWEYCIHMGRLAHGALDERQEALFALLEEHFEVVASQRFCVDEVARDDSIHLLSRQAHLLMRLDRREVVRRRVPTNHPVGAVRDRRLVGDCIEDGRLDLALLTPSLWEDVMDVEGNFLDVELLDGLFPKEVLGTFAQNEDVDTLVSSAETRAQRLQTARDKVGFRDGTRRRLGSINPGQELFDIVGDARLDGSAIEFPEHTAPVPLGKLGVDLGLQPAFLQPAQDGCKRHDLRAVGKVADSKEAFFPQELGSEQKATLYVAGEALIVCEFKRKDRGTLGAYGRDGFACLACCDVSIAKIEGVEKRDRLKEVCGLGRMKDWFGPEALF